ncbi:MAG: TolC family protein [Desulfobacteraceae bacterium]|nr:TolC family protein [Desulfobacteraceae bacterium]
MTAVSVKRRACVSLFLCIMAGFLTGCARFHPQPILPDKTALALESRTLDSRALERFIEGNLHHKIVRWPLESWDLETLALAAFYYHPDLDVARAKWEVAKAGVVTAGERPNPSIGFMPLHHTRTNGGLSPWTLDFNLDIPIETAGKRGYRIDRAKLLSEAARLRIVEAAWRVRSLLRRDLIKLYKAEQTEVLLRKQQRVQEEIVNILERRLSLGDVSQPDVTQAHLSLNQIRIRLAKAQGQKAEARAMLASAIGVPATALDHIDISFDFMEQPPRVMDVSLKTIRRLALLNRADILGALLKYAASESALQLEIAKQYPDIYIGPGYSWDQGDNKWSLGFLVSLPVFNHNQGPVAEAEARRKEAGAKFTALQSRIIGEIDRAFAGYSSALKELDTACVLLAAQKKQFESALAMFNAGEIDTLSLVSAKAELYSAALLQRDALAGLQQYMGLLEDAMQRPLQSSQLLPAFPEKNPRIKEMDKE